MSPAQCGLIGCVVHIMMQPLVCDGDFAIRVPDRHIGIGAHGDGPLAGIEAIDRVC